ncbi:MAG: porin [Phycisphaerales bacterium]
MIARNHATAMLLLVLSTPPALGGPTAGHDGKFFLADDSGDHRLDISAQLQIRYQGTFRDADPAVIGADNDVTLGFVMRRTKLRLDGRDRSGRLSYKLVGAFSRSLGMLALEDAQFTLGLSDDWSLTLGQFKAPLLREELVSFSSQLTSDRSVTTGTFTATWTQGVQLAWSSDRARTSAMVSDGLKQVNTSYNAVGESDFAITARAEVLLGKAGDWKRFNDFTSWRGSDFNAMLGGALNWQTTGDTNPSAASGAGKDIDSLTLTTDLSLEGNGWNAFACFIWRRTDAAAMPAFDDFGVIAQAGVFVCERTELFARWDAVFADAARGLAGDDLHTITAGLNYYFLPESHAAKFTANVLWFPEPANDLAGVVKPSDSFPLLADAKGDQIAFVIQLQLLF